MCLYTCVDMCVDMCVGMCVDMCIYVFVDMDIDAHTDVCRQKISPVPQTERQPLSEPHYLTLERGDSPVAGFGARWAQKGCMMHGSLCVGGYAILLVIAGLGVTIVA